ncbi:hypothetical protein B0H19DRAFT_1208878 [Mycena capillaripes]|nr:hypothetical protein B0H19DRAFT_1208878 [Mycena capillaripes]
MSSRRIQLPLHFIIVGCGLGGLTAAYCLGRVEHIVTVFEPASGISEVGAGIQVDLMVSLLCGKDLRAASVKPQANWMKWSENMDRYYGAPHFNIHVPTLKSGETFRADVILGADGIKSIVREVVVGGPDEPILTGDAAYRAIIPTSEMCKDLALKALVDYPEMIVWVGPARHVIGYCIRESREYNLVMAHPNRTRLTETYDSPDAVGMMREDFVGWEPRIQKLLALVSKTLIWPMFDRDPLQPWVHPSGKVALLGDACHPMLGSAMAIEDAAINSLQQIQPLLDAYQALRFSRTTTQLASRMNRNIFHLSDGPEQEARDASMRNAIEDAIRKDCGEPFADSGAGNANTWADCTKSRIQFGYDAEEEAEQWLCTFGPSVNRLLVSKI